MVRNESFPFLYVQILPFSHFCCISPESDPVAIYPKTRATSLSSVPQICRRELPNDAISHRLAQIFGPKLCQKLGSNRHVSNPLEANLSLSHTHTPSTATAQLVRCLLVAALARTPTFTGCRLM